MPGVMFLSLMPYTTRRSRSPLRAVAGFFPQRNVIERRLVFQALNDDQPYRVIATIGIADADHENPGLRARRRLDGHLKDSPYAHLTPTPLHFEWRGESSARSPPL